MARGYFMAMPKFHLPEYRLGKDLLNSDGRPLRLILTRHKQEIVKDGEYYAATLDYRIDRVSVTINKELISRVDGG